MGTYADFIAGLAGLEGVPGVDLPDGAAQTVRQAIQGLTDLPALARDIAVYRMRPLNPEFPALWNWLPDGRHDLADTVNHEENITVNVRIGIVHTDTDSDLESLLAYADAFCDVVDGYLRPNGGHALFTPLVQESIRAGMRNRPDEFGEIPVLCAEFPITARLRRVVP